MEIETFDDGNYVDSLDDANLEDQDSWGEEEDSNDSWDEEDTDSGEEEGEEEERNRDEIDEDSTLNMLEESEDKKTEKDEEEDSDKDEDSEKTDEDSESDELSKDDVGADADSSSEGVRILKAFKDGKEYEVPEDATIRVKVDGKWQKVPVTELRDNYAGKVAYDEKFSALSKDRNEFKKESEQYQQEISSLRDHLINIRQLTEKGMRGEVSPNSAMNYLLDLMQINTVDYNKAVLANSADEFGEYLQMTEFEREAYWAKKENEYLVRKQESSMRKSREEQTQAEFRSKLNQLREAHGISEDDYVSAETDLKSQNVKDITPELVVQAAKLKPLVSTAQDLIEEYLDQMSDDEANELVVEISTSMLKNPRLSPQKVKQLLAAQFHVEKIKNSLEKKGVLKKEQKVVSKKSSKPTKEIESFDDF